MFIYFGSFLYFNVFEEWKFKFHYPVHMVNDGLSSFIYDIFITGINRFQVEFTECAVFFFFLYTGYPISFLWTFW